MPRQPFAPRLIALTACAALAAAAPGSLVQAHRKPPHPSSRVGVAAVSPPPGAVGVRPDQPLDVQVHPGSSLARALNRVRGEEDGSRTWSLLLVPVSGYGATHRASALLLSLGHELSWHPGTARLEGTHPLLARYTEYQATLQENPRAHPSGRQEGGEEGRPVRDQGKGVLVQWRFTTGSALGEPTHWTVAATPADPRVTGPCRIVLTARDDYGDPASDGEATLRATTPSVSLSPNPVRLAAGQAEVSVTDAQAGPVLVHVHTRGPYPRRDDVALSVPLTFRPGLPAAATLRVPTPVIAGRPVVVEGRVTDRYGNPVAPSTLQLWASAGSLPAQVTTAGDSGVFRFPYTPPAALTAPPGTPEPVTLRAVSHPGTASAAAAIYVDPGPAARLTLHAPASLTAGQSASLTGTVRDLLGNAVRNGTPVRLSAPAGELSPDPVIVQAGRFTALYRSPARLSGPPGRGEELPIRAWSGAAQAHLTVHLLPGSPASITLQVPSSPAIPGSRIAVSGTVQDAYGNPVEDGTQVTVRVGSAPPVTAVTEGGRFATNVLLPPSGPLQVTATAGGASASLSLPLAALAPVGSTLSLTATPSAGAYRVAGQVQFPPGQPPRPVPVLLSTGGALGTVRAVWTDARGSFTAGVRAAPGTSAITVRAVLPTAGVAPPAATAVIWPALPATQTWQPTGVTVAPGDLVSVQEEGSTPVPLAVSLGGPSGPLLSVDQSARFVAGASDTLQVRAGPSSVGAVPVQLVVSSPPPQSPTLTLQATPASPSPGGTVSLGGNLELDSLPVVGAPVSLSATAGTLSAPMAVTDAQGTFGASLTAPAQSPVTVTAAVYAPPLAARQQVTLDVSSPSPATLSVSFFSAFGEGSGFNAWAPEYGVSVSTAGFYPVLTGPGPLTGVYQAQGIQSRAGAPVYIQALAPSGTYATGFSFAGYFYNGLTTEMRPTVWALTSAGGSLRATVIWQSPAMSGVTWVRTPVTLTLPPGTVGVRFGVLGLGGSYAAADWAALYTRPTLTLSSGAQVPVSAP